MQVLEGKVPGTLADAWVYCACVDMAEVCQRKSSSLPDTVDSSSAGASADGGPSTQRELACVLAAMLLFARERLCSLALTLHGWLRPVVAHCHYPGSPERA